jgi:hypothetical protein
VVLTLDGFSSHLNVPEAMDVFHEHKIFIVKEEGDASDTNQPYDQAVAKDDKKNIRYLLDTCRIKIKNITQWDLIATCIIALEHVKRESWNNSFKKVNLHPEFRIPLVSGSKRLKKDRNWRALLQRASQHYF